MEEQQEERAMLALAINTVQGQIKISACTAQRSTVRLQDSQADVDAPDHYSMSVVEFLDNTQLSVLDTYLTQLGEVDIHIAEDQMTNLQKKLGKRFSSLIEGHGLEVRSHNRNLFVKKGDTISTILALARSSAHIIHKVDCELVHCHPLLEFFINKLSLRDPAAIQDRYEVEWGSLDSYMRLDSAAAEAISLMPVNVLTCHLDVQQPGQSQFSTATHPSSSLYGLLNQCRTKLGSRLLQRWLRQPLVDVQAIERRQDIVQLFTQHNLLRDQLRDGPLKAVPDLDQVISRMRRKQAGLEEVFRLYLFVRALPTLGELLEQVATAQRQRQLEQEGDEGAGRILAVLDEMFSMPLQNIIKKFALYEALVEQVLDFNTLPEFRISPSFSGDLQGLADQLRALEQAAESVHGTVSRQFPELKLERHTMYGLVMRSPRAEQEAVYKQHKELSILGILKSGVFITTKKLQQISHDMQGIQREYEEMSAEIVAKALETANTYVNLIEAVGKVVAELDVLTSFAAVAACSSSYTRPSVLAMGSGVLDIEDARHPCVEAMGTSEFIPNSYVMKRGESNFHIITGPNMGGKSTYIRALGCLVLMAQVGCFLPCTRAVVSCVDSILARVGAGDSQQKGVSTFMAEMLESSVILHTATANSLVIIDELGRGTSTFDGFGLAYAISHFLASSKRCFSLFATHFHEVTALQEDSTGVVNQHVAAQMVDDNLVMLYKLRPGVCWESYGVPVAKQARFPPSVLAVAQRKLEALERSLAVHEEEQGRGKEVLADEQQLGKRQREMWGQQEQALESFGAVEHSTPANLLQQRLRAWVDQLPVSLVPQS